MRIQLRPTHRPEVLLGAAKAKLYVHKRLIAVLCFCFSLFLLLYGKTIFHVTREFVIHSNFNFNLCKRFHHISYAENVRSSVPKVIHQIFLNASEDHIEFFRQNIQNMDSWQRMNPDFMYILWNESMVVGLINKSYPSVLHLYERYKDVWIARMDIARYVVVHHMGGAYADIDLECKRPIGELYQEIGDRKVALNYSYEPFGIANNFFVASRNHEFLAHVIDGLAEADVLYFTPYINLMFRTGPMYLLGRYLNYIHKEDIFIMQTSQVYVVVDQSDHSWHGLDGLFIRFVWTSVNAIHLLSILVILVFMVRIHSLLTVRREIVSNIRQYPNTNKCVRQYHPSQLSMSTIIEDEPL
ncbi:uncharacterized protein LOC127838563 [Dreissena polymorpha]|uniref:Uncharacterized protein n=1 Tax=Dreissena polymorpha TaxID=45954 RepID=A0A9D4J290_DREPO|nr:uncharacterized protein LOC127838563 [Dreissena polymorpha]XP_052222337.1 uncharacterized protein LOC127838563 [Dreissena polymorpha]KAH3792847.1 hypothetical protein DPMN_146346 [Dreissena polymorpha]